MYDRNTLGGTSESVKDANGHGRRTDELIICDLGWIKLDPQSLCMVRVPIADLMIGWICDTRKSTCISDGSFEDALAFLDRPVLEEYMLDTPKAAGGKCSDLGRGNGGRGHAASVLGHVFFGFASEE